MDWWAPGAPQIMSSDIENSLSEPGAELQPLPRKGFTKHLTKIKMFKIPDLFNRPTAAPVATVNRR